jgi:hypothetical protein
VGGHHAIAITGEQPQHETAEGQGMMLKGELLKCYYRQSA